MEDEQVHILRNDGDTGLSQKPNALRTGQNSGYQAIGLAIAAGVRKVVLLGYDMKYAEGGKKSHWHGGHPLAMPEAVYKMYAKHFPALVGCGVEIVNASLDSSLTCFPRMTIEEALQ